MEGSAAVRAAVCPSVGGSGWLGGKVAEKAGRRVSQKGYVGRLVTLSK